MTNKEFAQQERFIEACKAIGIKPTTRAASKLRNGKGILAPLIKSLMKKDKKGE